MFLKQKQTDELIEVLTPSDVWDPCISTIAGQSHSGEEMQDPEIFRKVDLVFPSNEALPRCWVDPHYRQHAQPLEVVMSS